MDVHNNPLLLQTLTHLSQTNLHVSVVSSSPPLCCFVPHCHGSIFNSSSKLLYTILGPHRRKVHLHAEYLPVQ